MYGVTRKISIFSLNELYFFLLFEKFNFQNCSKSPVNFKKHSLLLKSKHFNNEIRFC